MVVSGPVLRNDKNAPMGNPGQRWLFRVKMHKTKMWSRTVVDNNQVSTTQQGRDKLNPGAKTAKINSISAIASTQNKEST